MWAPVWRGRRSRATGGWDEGGNGTDAYGFSVLPAGNRDDSGYFDGVGSYAIFWSAMEIDTFYAYYWLLLSTFEYMYTDDYIKHYAFSVRCLKD